MPKKVPGRNTVSVILTNEEYEQLKTLSAKTHKSMGALVREYTTKGLSGEITENNIDFLAPIIREQLKSIMEPYMERMISLEAKACIQSGTAAYLAADAILKFVPPAQRNEVQESYDAAKKKSLAYMKSNVKIEE